MSTSTTTPTTPSSSRGRTVFVAGVSAIVAVGVAAGLFLAFSWPADGTPSAAVPASSSTTGGSGHHVNPPAPSAAVETLQRELGQLNYYEGPVNGIMNEQTVQAIKYLQRDAHLPQTGTMSSATQTALANFLKNGNSQMGS